MKYIITESRLEALIMNYLDSTIKGGKKVFHDEDDESYVGWEMNGEVVFAIKMNENQLGILDTFFDTLQNLFGLSKEQSEEYLLKWIEVNLGLVPTSVSSGEFS